MSNESEKQKCDHEELEWIEQDNLCLGCFTCNGSLRVDTWKCVACGETGTSEQAIHQAGESCNPIKWEKASE